MNEKTQGGKTNEKPGSAGIESLFLTLLLFVGYSVAAVAVGFTEMPRSSSLGNTMVPMLLMCLLQSAVLSYVVIRSRWRGWRLILAVLVIFYGITTLLSQIETVVFLRYLISVVPAEAIPRLFIQGAIVAVIFSPFVLVIHGKMQKEAKVEDSTSGLTMSWTEWLWRAVLIAVLYVVIYLSFGNFVFQPIAGKTFTEYYADLKLPPWMLPFQMVRAMVWLLLALPVMGMMKGTFWESRFSVALLFSVLMGSLLLSPNPYMPDAIRMAHFVEVITSNFLFGFFLVWILQYRPRRLR